jgi:protein SCO1/2
MTARPFSILTVMAAAIALFSSSPAVASGEHVERPVGIKLDPLFSLTSQYGERLPKDWLRGKPFLVLFGYTSCADVCPTALFEASLLLRQLGAGGDRLRVLFVTVDPERDTVEHLRVYLESFDSRIIGLTGSPSEVQAVAVAFGARPGDLKDNRDKDGIDHSTLMFLIDKYGMLSRRVAYDDPKALGTMSRRLLAQ